MSVVIVGGNECMAGRYESICSDYGCKVKVFTKESGGLKKKIGTPDLLVIFTSTVSHKMVISAQQEARRNNLRMERVRSSSGEALRTVLEKYKQT